MSTNNEFEEDITSASFAPNPANPTALGSRFRTRRDLMEKGGISSKLFRNYFFLIEKKKKDKQK